MQLNNINKLPQIAARTNFVIFELPAEVDFDSILPHAIHITPADGSSLIKIEQIRELAPIIQNKQHNDLTIVIAPADAMVEASSNAFLKQLEEPGEHIHFVFLTRKINAILPTIRSRAQIFYIKSQRQLGDAPDIDPKIIALAKEYLSLPPAQLPAFVKKLTKDSKSARSKATQMVDAAIELMYKSYFATGNPKFLDKLQRLITLQPLLANGNLKLQLVAHML